MIIKIADSENELEEVIKLRYEVNTLELQKDFLPKGFEPKDRHAVQLLASQNEQLLGCLRYRMPDSSDDLTEEWGIRHNLKIAITDRLAVLPKYRNSRVAYLLMLAVYKQALLSDAKLALIETEEHLLKMYRRLGFMPYREKQYAFGKRFQLFINPWDVKRLTELNSPFASVYEKYMQELNAFAQVA
ncbi:GNAT family N-acetyltransferase [Jiulongibacter sediminis]|jgi:predicted GNAT family N-acyltransferase|uniref:GNAT family N-acetyltransferase n=1 Tax=Jiulongibacter sediminis TaxID=1605367 RepID=UPI0026ED91C2|nr:GNAT family N-acetyltransferase [Jiulongibacter sediminis]